MPATLERVSVTALLPRTLEPATGERVRRALGTPLDDAVRVAFDALDDLDPGAYWVVRELRASVDIGVAEPDPARSAARIAQAMAAAVARAILDGPTAGTARFGSPARYLADYLRARLAGAGTGWVFERLRPLESLAPLDALVAATRVVEVALLDVVTELARTGDWDRAVDAASMAAVARLDATIPRMGTTGAVVDPARRDAVRRLRSFGVGTGARSDAERRLRLLGRLARGAVPTGADVAAVWAAEPDPADPSPRDVTPSGTGHPGDPARPAASSGPAAPEHADTEPDRPLLRCAGAPAFLLLPDLAELLSADPQAAWLAEPDPAAADVRAEVLRAVLGRGVPRDDPGVRLAAGVETWPPDPPVSPLVLPELTEPWLQIEHPGDDAWFAPTLTDTPALLPLARALARRFAGHLLGLGNAGMAYLSDRVLPLGGTIGVVDDAVLVDLPRPPLHVLLAMAGLDAFSLEVPWLDLPVLLTHEEG